MPSYLDTSALLRLVERRGDVSLVEVAMADEPLSSALADLECWSAIHKKWHDKEISEGQRDGLIDRARTLVLAVNLLALDDDVVTETRALTQRYALRTLDGIHLATAVRAWEKLTWTGGLRFCTADRRQAEAARQRLGEGQVDLVPSWR